MDESLIFNFTCREGTELVSRAADPYKIMRLIAHELGGEPLAQVYKTAQGPPSPLSLAAQERLLRAVQVAFGITPLQPDGTGSTEPAMIRVLKEFLRWRAEVKKNTVPSATDFMSPTDAGQPESLPESKCLPCGSTEGDERINLHAQSLSP